VFGGLHLLIIVPSPFCLLHIMLLQIQSQSRFLVLILVLNMVDGNSCIIRPFVESFGIQ
jgi:hypothetical protein